MRKRASMQSKSEDSSDETCCEHIDSQCFNDDGRVPSIKGKSCDNLLGVSSSQDSLSENAESKTTIRVMKTCDQSEDFEMHPKLSSGSGQLSPKPEIDSDQKSIKDENAKVTEGHDDNISCINKSNDASTAVSHDEKIADDKDFVHSSPSECVLGQEKAETSLFSQKLDLLEVSVVTKSDGGASSHNVQNPFSRPQNDICATWDSSEVLSETIPKPEPITDKTDVKDNRDLPDANEPTLSDMQEPNSQATSGNESDESDIVEHDVKVCDICGDAGREDLLAICSKCSDGAEHTYCMREMRKKVPEGNWLCEECQLVEYNENQDKDIVVKRTNKTSASVQISGKRHADIIEASTAAKRQAIETNLGSPKSSSSSRMPVLSRNSSFKSSDKGKVRPATFGNHSGSDVSEPMRTTGPLHQMPKGTLMKSNSFSTLNSKPKVKPVDEAISQKHKGNRELTPLDSKEGRPRMMSKSMSFRSYPGRPSAGESKLKMLSPKFSHSQDMKGLKQVKDRNAFERKNLSKSGVSVSKVDQKFTYRSESTSPSSMNNRESKVVKTEGKSSVLSKSNNNLGRKAQEVSVPPVGAPSNGGNIVSLTEAKANLIIPKDEVSSSSSWSADRSVHNNNEIMQDVHRSIESTNHSEKTNVSRTRHYVTAGSKDMCKKCKEMGHDVDSCPSNVQGCAVDVSAGKNSREEIVKSNKLKAAIEAAMPKLSLAYGKNKLSDLADANVDLNSDGASQDLVANKKRNIINIEETHEPQAGLQSRFSDNKQASVSHLKPSSGNSTNVLLPLKVGDPHSAAYPSAGKPITTVWSGHSMADAFLTSKILAFPEHEYIWQGGFEVHRGGKPSELCCGIQAHLSSCASPRVLEVVNKFPQKIHLNEVPRLSTWPTKFHEDGTKEDNIALYFFAQDIESYERHYKGLLDGMIKNDLALRGNRDGVELLVFPSSQLPESCQRWNMLYFLWGVFRVRKANCSETLKDTNVTGSNVASLDKDGSNHVMSAFENHCLPKHIDQGSSASGRSHDVAAIPYDSQNTCITNNGNRDNKQAFIGSQTYSLQHGRFNMGSSAMLKTKDVPLYREMGRTIPPPEECNQLEHGQDTEELKPCLQVDRVNPVSKGEKSEMLVCASAVEDRSSVKIFPISNQDVPESIVPEKQHDTGKSGRVQVDLERDLKEEEDAKTDSETSIQRDLNHRGHDRWQSNQHRSPYLDFSPEPYIGTSQKRSWDEVIVDQRRTSKKPKTGLTGTYGCSSSSSRSIDACTDGVSSKGEDHGSCLIEEKQCVEFCEEKVIPEDTGTQERFFFPVASQVKDFHLGTPLKEVSKDDGIPNLELALGAETKPQNKGMLPFFVGMVDKSNNEGKPPDKEEEEDVSAALSLSLSFPIPETEQADAVSKSEQLLSERRHVNTSLLLFGGYLDK